MTTLASLFSQGPPSAELQLQPDGRNIHVDVVDTAHLPMAQSRWRKAESPSGRVNGSSSAEAHALLALFSR